MMLEERATGLRFGRLVVAALLTVFPFITAHAEIATGPEIGAGIPTLAALDQNGRLRTFEDLRGPEGLLLLFYRTADW